MEIRSEKRVLPANCFKGLSGVIDVSFQPKQGETYICVKPCVVNNTEVTEGMKLKLSFKNKKYVYYELTDVVELV